MFDSLVAAASRRDRAALEQLYAAEFQFVHATGGIVSRAEQIDGLVNRQAPVTAFPLPPLDSIRVYGDVAMYRRLQGGIFGIDVWVKRDGRWQIALVQGTMLPVRRAGIAIDVARLAEFAGRFTLDSGVVTLTVVGDSLTVARGTGPRTALRPVGDDRFEDRFGATLTFSRDPTGAVTQFVYRTAVGAERIWKKDR